MWSTGSSNPQNKKGDAAFYGKEHDAEKTKSAVNLSPSSSALSREQDDITKKKDKGKSPVEYFTGNRDLNACFKDYSEDNSNDVSAAGPIVPTAGKNYSNSTNPFSAAGPSNTNISPTHEKPSLKVASQLFDKFDTLEMEDIAYFDHENVGAEADFNNLETFITVSLIPTTRTHKAHPISQITGDLSSTTQTRSMTRLIKDQGNLVRGLPIKVFENNNTCVACKKGKQQRASCKTKPVSSVNQPLFSRFTWVFFWATKDKTSPILKTFITGLENQISLKGIKREFSVPRTPQQNVIAGRKNRTLIKAARTMLADSLLPIPFWAKAVNTACYVQNRVLVTKPHNNTPYELLHGQTLSIGFMRPFGCPVTILNTLDPLGKFKGKVDEGFLVGYSVNSKAFRVFNSRTQKKGDAAFYGKEHDAEKSESAVNLSPSSSALSREQDDITKKKDKGKSPVEYFTGNRDLNAYFEDYSEDSSNDVSAVGPIVPTAGKTTLTALTPLVLLMEDIAYFDHENVGAEADFNNLETF
nr:hypothetical protein [Tanacetum cinerariifolium]